MTYVILDLEFNGAYSKKKNRFVNEIIEFGAVKCDEQLNIVDTFSALVTPQISKKLNSHVSRLTHINMSELQECNNAFTHVLSRFKKFLGDSVLMSWGRSDIHVLMENCLYYYGDEKLPFVSAYANVQSYCERAMDYHDDSHQMGLSTCAEKLGIGFDDGTLHRALTDAELTALCARKLFDPELLSSMIMKCDDDFYQRITFKNYNICDAKSPDIDRREFYFVCDHCGRKAWRRGKWKLKNKSFRASFRCLRCRRDFEGRITFKKTYDGVVVIRRAVDIPKPESKQAQHTEPPVNEAPESTTTENPMNKQSEKPMNKQNEKNMNKQSDKPVNKQSGKHKKPAEKQPKERPVKSAPDIVLIDPPRKKPTDQPLSD